MLCPGVTWIRKIIRKLLVLYSLPPNPQRPLALSVSLSVSVFLSEGRAHLHEDDAPTGPRRIRHRQPVPKGPSWGPVLCVSVAVCMQSVCTLQTVLFYFLSLWREISYCRDLTQLLPQRGSAIQVFKSIQF